MEEEGARPKEKRFLKGIAKKSKMRKEKW